MIDFAGWEMPVHYESGIISEHRATRKACGIFDTCHMGEFLLEGPNVPTVLNRCLAGDFRQLGHGRQRYTFITNEGGGVIDDAVVMLFSGEIAWLIVNAANIAGDFAAIRDRLPPEVRLEDISARTAKIDVQGPAAWKVVQTVLRHDLRAMPFYSFLQTSWQGRDVILSRSGYTGEPGVEIYITSEQALPLWEMLMEAGKPLGAVPCGLGARDTLRLEAGLPLYGYELNQDITPFHAGLGKFVSLDKPEDFPGKSALKKAAAEIAHAREQSGEIEILAGLRLKDKRSPRSGFAVLANGQKIGRVCSGSLSPTLEAGIAMAYVQARHALPGKKLTIDIRGKEATAEVVKLPFYANPELRLCMTA